MGFWEEKRDKEIVIDRSREGEEKEIDKYI